MGSGERRLVPSDTHQTNVVGESNYQSAIWRATGTEPSPGDHREWRVKVVVTPEPMNDHDPNAIAVRSLDGETLGYLPQAAAALIQLDHPLTVDATVRGGFELFRESISPLSLTLHVERRRT